jgi:hypothetical protein
LLTTAAQPCILALLLSNPVVHDTAAVPLGVADASLTAALAGREQA